MKSQAITEFGKPLQEIETPNPVARQGPKCC